jgi:Flp pilus assembly protein TadD
MHWMPWSGAPWRLVGESQLARRQFAAARRSLETGIAKDPHDWELWLDLSLSSRGPARRQAATRALMLNPGNNEVAAVARQLHIARPDRAGR